MKTLQVLTILTTLTIGSGCQHNLIQPFCLPDRPELEAISVEAQRTLKKEYPEDLVKIAVNDIKLKSHIRTIERLSIAHNKQFKTKCFTDTE